MVWVGMSRGGFMGGHNVKAPFPFVLTVFRCQKKENKERFVSTK
jgi:hypothetical protein